MIFNFTSPTLVPLLISALISCSVAIYAWTRRINTADAFWLSLLAVATAEWTFGYALEIAGADLSTKLFWGKLQYLGISAIPLFWLIFAYNHANPGNRLTHRRIYLLSILPGITTILGLTTEFHRLLWQTYAVAYHENLSVLDISHGPWFWVTITYSYIYLAVGTFFILRSLGRMKGLYLGQTFAIIVSLIAPWIGNVLYISRASPIPYLDITPFAFAFSVAGITWGILGFRLMDISPLARDTVLENMREGMIVLDSRWRIVDINPAAGRMIGLPLTQAIGKPVNEVFSPWPRLVARLRDDSEGDEVIKIGQGDVQRRYSVQISFIPDNQNRTIGRMLSIRSLEEETFPEPRYALREPVSRPVDEILGKRQDILPKTRKPIWRWISDFFLPSALRDIPVSSGVNRAWAQAMERTVTTILRISAIIGTFTVILSLPEIMGLFVYTLSVIIFVILLWILSIWRSLPLQLRSRLFLFAIYILAFIEIYNYGYSVEAFIFLIAFSILGVLFEDLRGGLWAMVTSLITLGIFGWLFSQGLHHSPVGLVPPANFESAFASMSAYAAISGALLASINTLLHSLHGSWQKETQALNLLQQERDMLEQRVIERTRDLAKTRDDAIQSRDELRKYFLSMEQSGNTIIITDPQGNIEYVNPTFENFTGYSRSETIGKNPRFLKSGKQDLAFYKNLWATITAGTIWHGELNNKRKDGSQFWESATIAPLINDDGEITNYIAIKENISTKKELQERLSLQNETLLREVTARQHTTMLLSESETRFRQIVENASDIIYRTDAQGHFTYANPTALHLMSLNDEREIIRRHYLELAVPAVRHKLKRFYDRQFLTRKQTTYFEFQAITRDGREIWLGQNVQLITEGNKIIGFQAVAREITAIKQTQAALAISRDQALEASRLKSQMLSRVSHELRTPLGTILGYSELLAMNTFGELNNEQKDATKQIMLSIDYLSKLVNDLLDQAQAESKRMRLHRISFSPAGLLQKVQPGMEVLAQNKGLELKTTLAPDCPEMLYEDERRLQQILINLTGNAIKFTTSGRIEIKIYRAATTQWALQVSDTGAGISKDAHAYIFEPFRQIDNSITRENRGTGLGLSITKQLVELMDGKIDIESAIGQGSTFTVTLPILLPPKQHQPYP